MATGGLTRRHCRLCHRYGDALRLCVRALSHANPSGARACTAPVCVPLRGAKFLVFRGLGKGHPDQVFLCRGTTFCGTPALPLAHTPSSAHTHPCCYPIATTLVQPLGLGPSAVPAPPSPASASYIGSPNGAASSSLRLGGGGGPIVPPARLMAGSPYLRCVFVPVVRFVSCVYMCVCACACMCRGWGGGGSMRGLGPYALLTPPHEPPMQ